MSQRRYGAALSYLSMAVSLTIAFLLTPILLEVLGKGQYGLYSLVASFVAYFMMADIGLNDTVLRYVVRYTHSGDREELGTFLGATLVGYLGVVLLVLGVGIAGFALLTPEVWPRLSAVELQELKFMYGVGLASACVLLMANPFGAILSAHQKFIFLQVAGIATGLISAALVVAYLQYGQSVRIVFILNTAVQASVALFQIGYVLTRIRPPFRLRAVSVAYVREKLNFAAPIFIVVLVEMIYWRLDNLIIGSMVGAASVAIYAIGMLFQKHLQRLATTISRVWIPHLIQLMETGAGARETTMLVVKIARLQMLVVLPVMAGIVFFGRDFLRLWLGPDFVAAYPIMLLILLPFSIEVIGGIRNTVLQVRGLYWRRAVATVIIAVLNVVLTIILIPRVGIIGAAIGTGAGILCSYAYIHLLLHAKGGFLVGVFYRELLRGLWIVVIGLAAAGAALNLWPTAGWFEFIAKGALFVAAYAPLAWLLGMNQGERGYLLSFARDARLIRP